MTTQLAKITLDGDDFIRLFNIAGYENLRNKVLTRREYIKLKPKLCQTTIYLVSESKYNTVNNGFTLHGRASFYINEEFLIMTDNGVYRGSHEPLYIIRDQINVIVPIDLVEIFKEGGIDAFCNYFELREMG